MHQDILKKWKIYSVPKNMKLWGMTMYVIIPRLASKLDFIRVAVSVVVRIIASDRYSRDK